MDPPKKSIFTAQLRVPVCFDISRDLIDKYFGIVWGCHPPPPPPPRGPSNGPFKYQFFEWLNLPCQCFMISGDI